MPNNDADRDWRSGNPAYDDIKHFEEVDERLPEWDGEGMSIVPDRVEAAKVIATAKVEEVPQKWYFTFGYDHVDHITGVQLRNKYCVVDATYGAARQIIMDRFDNQWSMVYPYANDLPEEERVVDGKQLPPFKWRGAGVEKYSLELFDHATSTAVIADDMSTEEEYKCAAPQLHEKYDRLAAYDDHVFGHLAAYDFPVVEEVAYHPKQYDVLGDW